MSGNVSLGDFIKSLPPDQQREIAKGTKKMIAQERVAIRRREAVRSLVGWPMRVAGRLRVLLTKPATG